MLKNQDHGTGWTIKWLEPFCSACMRKAVNALINKYCLWNYLFKIKYSINYIQPCSRPSGLPAVWVAPSWDQTLDHPVLATRKNGLKKIRLYNICKVKYEATHLKWEMSHLTCCECVTRFLTSILYDLFPSGFIWDKLTKKMSNLSPRWASYSGVSLRGVHHTAESDSPVCIIPWNQTPRCASYCGIRLPGVHHTAESRKQNISKVRNKKLYGLYVFFKRDN